ncbi:MAG: sensor histidine kinase [Acidimicrobiales bacterium]
MRKRLTLVIVGTALVIILAAGTGSWLIARQSARTSTVGELLASVQRFGGSEDGVLTISGRGELTSIRNAIKLSASLSDARFVPVNHGKVTAGPPPGVPDSVLGSLAASGPQGTGYAVAGSTGPMAWAAKSLQLVMVTPTLIRAPRYLLVITRPIAPTKLSDDFYLLAGALIVFALVVAFTLSHQITRPLRRAVEATRRIAAGDLRARVGALDGELPELSSLGKSIDVMADGLNRAASAQRQFLLSVSHELRTPLTSIRGYAEAAVDGAIAPDVAAGVIVNESRRLERLVGDLSELAKLDARTFSFDIREIDVCEVLEEVSEEMRPLVSGSGLHLELALPQRPAIATADPDRLGQILTNLVENAVRYAGSTIRLGCLPTDVQGLITVEDDGPGIAARDIHGIFERHYTSERRPFPGRPAGSGLGLAIASELAAAMGGTIRAESPTTDSGGTRMTVALQMAKSSSNPHTFLTAPSTSAGPMEV